ncbi:MAG: EscU/YscU/HrcU family type III secretion system export apparatus switch protein, partial [Acidobacteria bacterium]|nr:EscU/YscU/HrcU family type III secretion system export apparatus switch protein [Acidobacteriota bacterium]
MSDQQKNEQPTQRRIDKARRDGQYPAAKELVGALQFLSFTAMLAWGAGWWFESIKAAARFLLGRAFAPQFGPGELVGLSAVLLWRVGLPLLLGGAALIVVMLAARLATTRMGLSLKKLSPDFKRLSPLARLKELPRQNLPALVQALVMLPLFGAAVYAIARDHLDIYLALPLAGVQSGVGHVASTL